LPDPIAPDLALQREEFLAHIAVDTGTLKKLDRYAELLTEWGQKFNLVSRSTLPQIWQRHILDSAQLARHIPADARKLADLGSGAGLPGIILSIMGAHEVHLIESIGKKANFLRMVAEELGLNVKVHQERIEDLPQALKFDVVTARALKSLTELLDYARPLMRTEAICVFLKGQNLAAELTETRKYWKFGSETIKSLSDPSGSVLIIRDPHRQAKIRANDAKRKSR
jgi:16S rRNA (guanine527-N7)-methyltransferase